MLLIGALVLLQTIQLPPPPRGFGTERAEVVVDAAGVLSPETVERINRIAFDVHEKSGGEITVVTLPDIGQRDVSDVALAIGRQWGVGSSARIGDRQRNAGAVVLVVPKETASDGRGRCWVSTGQGAEGFILDADAGAFCREVTPFFQQRDYSTAIELLSLRVAGEYAREFNFALDTSIAPPVQLRPQPRPGGSGGFNPSLLLIAFIVLVFFMNSIGGGRRRRRGCLPLFIPMGGGGYHRGGWGGGGFGGGGGGFGGFGGGGGFSGGGGGSSW